MDLALVGLPLSGKTTTFVALTSGHAGGEGAPRREHLGVVKVPDERLDKLSRLVGARKTAYAEVRLHDLPPLFQKGRAPVEEALETLSRADALLHVVRAFHRDDVPHPQGRVDPQRDIAAFETELILRDLTIVERRLERLDITVRSARPGEREAGEREQQLLQRVRRFLEAETPLRSQQFSPDESRVLANFGFLSLKPMLILLNIDEVDAIRTSAIEEKYRERYQAPGTLVTALCAKLEAELAELPPEEAAEFRQELEGGDTPGQRVLRLVQDLLGLITFYTVVGEECRAWPVPAGTTALQAAGRIHSDMERGFIRAEVISWDRLLEQGSLAEAKRHGLLRSEGKQYVVRDGDVLHILFHV